MKRGPYKKRHKEFEKARALRAQGYGYRVIAERVGISVWSARNWVIDMPVEANHRRNAYLKARNEQRIPLENLKRRKNIRLRLIEERGHRCEGCHLTEWRGEKIPLDLHHANGRSQKREDLFLYCPNCHAQTEGWRGKRTE